MIALEEIESEILQLEKYKLAYETLKVANDFYANVDNYELSAFSRDGTGRPIDKLDWEKIQNPYGESYQCLGGKRAREAKKKAEEYLK